MGLSMLKTEYYNTGLCLVAYGKAGRLAIKTLSVEWTTGVVWGHEAFSRNI